MPHTNRKSRIANRKSLNPEPRTLNPSSQRSPNLPLPRVVDAATLAEIDAALDAGERPGALFARLELAQRFDLSFDQLRYYQRKRRKTAPDSPLSPDSPPAIAAARPSRPALARSFSRRAARRNVRQLRDLLTAMDEEFAGVEACDIHHRAQLLAAFTVAAVLVRDAATLPMSTIIQAARALTDLWSGASKIPFLERYLSEAFKAPPEEKASYARVLADALITLIEPITGRIARPQPDPADSPTRSPGHRAPFAETADAQPVTDPQIQDPAASSGAGTTT